VEKAKRGTKMGAHVRMRGTEPFGCSPSESWNSYNSVATLILRYRRGGNRPITRRLLICRAQTAAVLPPMRNPQHLYSEYICLEFPIARIRFPFGLTLGYSIGHSLFRSFSCSYSARVALLLLLLLPQCLLPTRCSDKTFLNWVSFEGSCLSPALLEAVGFHLSDYLSIFVLL